MLRLKIPSNLENIEDFLGISLISLQNCWTTCSTSVPISLCRHPAGIHSANCDPEISKCAWPTSKFSVFTHITSKPLLTRGVLGPHIRMCLQQTLCSWICTQQRHSSLLSDLLHRWQLFTLQLWQCCSQQAKEFLAVLLTGEAFTTHKQCKIHPRVWEGDSTSEPHSITRVPVTATGATATEALQEGDEKPPPTTWLLWDAAWIQVEAATEVMAVCGLLSFQLDVLWGSVYQNIWDLLICGYCAGFRRVCWPHTSHSKAPSCSNAGWISCFLSLVRGKAYVCNKLLEIVLKGCSKSPVLLLWLGNIVLA